MTSQDISPLGLPEIKGKRELYKGDTFALFKSGNNWDTGLSFDENIVRYFFVLHKKPPTLSLRFKMKVIFCPYTIYFPNAVI